MFIKFSKTVFYEVSLVSQCSLLEVLLTSKFGFERGEGKYFDAAVVFVKKTSLLFRLALAVLCMKCRCKHIWQATLLTYNTSGKNAPFKMILLHCGTSLDKFQHSSGVGGIEVNLNYVCQDRI